LRGLLLRPALTRRRGRTASDAPSVAPAPLSVRLLPSTGRRPVCTPAAVASYRPAHRARGNDLLKKALLYLVLAMLALVLTVAGAAYLVVKLALRPDVRAYALVCCGWTGPPAVLELLCAPCSATVPALGSTPSRLARLRITARRDA